MLSPLFPAHTHFYYKTAMRLLACFVVLFTFANRNECADMKLSLPPSIGLKLKQPLCIRKDQIQFRFYFITAYRHARVIIIDETIPLQWFHNEQSLILQIVL